MADLFLIVLYLGGFVPLMYFGEKESHFWIFINLFLVFMTFIKLNSYLKIFDAFSFLVFMIQAVFIDLRIFLAYYLMVMTLFGFVFMILFGEPSQDSEGLGPFSFILMSFRIVWGAGDFEIENTNYKIMGWISYMLIMVAGNIVFLNFLIAVVN